MYGTTQMPVNTFNKVWIMADRAEVFEHNQTAFVVDSHLKVMLEEDYLALTKNTQPVSSRSTVIPAKRNPYHCVLKSSDKSSFPNLKKKSTPARILPICVKFLIPSFSSWYKKNLKEALLNQVYADKAKVKGINLNDPTIKQQIYEQYLKAYKKGVFNYIKEDVNAVNGETMPRKYFSGGINEAMAAKPVITHDAAMLNILQDESLVSMTTGLDYNSILPGRDAAMNGDELRAIQNALEQGLQVDQRLSQEDFRSLGFGKLGTDVFNLALSDVKQIQTVIKGATVVVWKGVRANGAPIRPKDASLYISQSKKVYLNKISFPNGSQRRDIYLLYADAAMTSDVFLDGNKFSAQWVIDSLNALAFDLELALKEKKPKGAQATKHTFGVWHNELSDVSQNGMLQVRNGIINEIKAFLRDNKIAGVRFSSIVTSGTLEKPSLKLPLNKPVTMSWDGNSVSRRVLLNMINGWAIKRIVKAYAEINAAEKINKLWQIRDLLNALTNDYKDQDLRNKVAGYLRELGDDKADLLAKQLISDRRTRVSPSYWEDIRAIERKFGKDDPWRNDPDLVNIAVESIKSLAATEKNHRVEDVQRKWGFIWTASKQEIYSNAQVMTAQGIAISAQEANNQVLDNKGIVFLVEDYKRSRVFPIYVPIDAAMGAGTVSKEAWAYFNTGLFDQPALPFILRKHMVGMFSVRTLSDLWVVIGQISEDSKKQSGNSVKDYLLSDSSVGVNGDIKQIFISEFMHSVTLKGANGKDDALNLLHGIFNNLNNADTNGKIIAALLDFRNALDSRFVQLDTGTDNPFVVEENKGIGERTQRSDLNVAIVRDPGHLLVVLAQVLALGADLVITFSLEQHACVRACHAHNGEGADDSGGNKPVGIVQGQRNLANPPVFIPGYEKNVIALAHRMNSSRPEVLIGKGRHSPVLWTTNSRLRSQSAQERKTCAQGAL